MVAVQEILDQNGKKTLKDMYATAFALCFRCAFVAKTLPLPCVSAAPLWLRHRLFLRPLPGRQSSASSTSMRQSRTRPSCTRAGSRRSPAVREKKTPQSVMRVAAMRPVFGSSCLLPRPAFRYESPRV